MRLFFYFYLEVILHYKPKVEYEVKVASDGHKDFRGFFILRLRNFTTFITKGKIVYKTLFEQFGLQNLYLAGHMCKVKIL